MREQATNSRHEAILALLDEVMAILRDGKPFNAQSPIFGQIQAAEKLKRTVGLGYEYKNNTIQAMTLAMTTEADPLNYAEDRASVPIVPSNFFIDFAVPVQGFTWAEIQKRLDLADYWVDTNGGKQEGNCFPASPPNEWITICRYRANAHADSRFPVDVELGFFGPRTEGAYDLDRITINRAYPYLTPEMRKQKREERVKRIREEIGYTGEIDE